MHKYRVFDKEKSLFLPPEGLFLSPEGSVFFNWVIQDTEKFEVQPALNLGEASKLDVYVGDAFSVKIPDKWVFLAINSKLEASGCKFIPPNYDEVIVQIERTGNDPMYYWILFKLNGEFIKSEDVEGLLVEHKTEELPEGGFKNFVTIGSSTIKRAIPTDDMGILMRLTSMDTCTKLSDCTSSDWFDLNSPEEHMV